MMVNLNMDYDKVTGSFKKNEKFHAAIQYLATNFISSVTNSKFQIARNHDKPSWELVVIRDSTGRPVVFMFTGKKDGYDSIIAVYDESEKVYKPYYSFGAPMEYHYANPNIKAILEPYYSWDGIF